mmetsp:Transcript_11759/g.19149  ORF Transcript_11759/g.19149 Transcript_11759/m.19149 type:complete len:492 (-) Transcript_11759:34-1509(-)
MAANPNDEDFDEAPAFIDMNSAVEVPDDTNNEDTMMGDEAMVDDADEALASKLPNLNNESSSSQPVIDQSKATFNSHTDAVYAVASHYDASSHTLSIASGGGDDRAYLHHISTNTATNQLSQTTTPLSHPHTDSISCLAFNTPYITTDVSGKVQKNLLAVGCYDGAIVLYDAANGSLVQVLEGPSDVEWTCFHPKGGTVLLAGSIADGTIWMYHAPSKSCLQVFVGHEGGVTAGAFTPDGKLVASVGQDGTCRVWAPKTGMSKHVFRLMESMGGGDDGSPGPGLTCLAVGGGTDGKLAICGGEDGKAYVVHISGKKLVATLPHFEEQQQQSNGNNNNNNNNNNNGDAMDDDAEAEPRSIEAVGFCPAAIPGTAHWCATGGVDGILKIWNLNTATSGGTAQLRQRCVREDVPSQSAGITRLTWHASLPLVICSYTDGVVGVWDARVGTMVGTLTGHEDMINDMSVSFVEGSGVGVVVTGSDDKMVKMFEYNP